MTPSATILVPAPGFAEKGVLQGRQAAADVFAYHDGVAGLAWSVRTLSAVGDDVTFEAVVTNPSGEPPISLLLLLVFVMEGDQVAHLREYAVYTGDEGHGWGAGDTTSEAFAYRSPRSPLPADAAIDAWVRAIESGDAYGLTSLCSTDLTFAIPMAIPEWRGEQHGPERFAELVTFEKTHIHKGMTVEVVRRTYGDRAATAQVVCRATRRDSGEAFENALVVTFAFDDENRVVDLREWTWDLHPEAAAREAGLID